MKRRYRRAASLLDFTNAVRGVLRLAPLSPFLDVPKPKKRPRRGGGPTRDLAVDKRGNFATTGGYVAQLDARSVHGPDDLATSFDRPLDIVDGFTASGPKEAIDLLVQKYAPQLCGAQRTAASLNGVTGLSVRDGGQITWHDVRQVREAFENPKRFGKTVLAKKFEEWFPKCASVSCDTSPGAVTFAGPIARPEPVADYGFDLKLLESSAKAYDPFAEMVATSMKQLGLSPEHAPTFSRSNEPTKTIRDLLRERYGDDFSRYGGAPMTGLRFRFEGTALDIMCLTSDAIRVGGIHHGRRIEYAFVLDAVARIVDGCIELEPVVPEPKPAPTKTIGQLLKSLNVLTVKGTRFRFRGAELRCTSYDGLHVRLDGYDRVQRSVQFEFAVTALAHEDHGVIVIAEQALPSRTCKSA
jgi:hypothetical protein